jgi:hypothetical protein
MLKLFFFGTYRLTVLNLTMLYTQANYYAMSCWSRGTTWRNCVVTVMYTMWERESSPGYRTVRKCFQVLREKCFYSELPGYKHTTYQ